MISAHVLTPKESPVRCGWASAEPIYQAYHDEEWGVPEWDSLRLFEKLILDGFQAGLSWITILRKREGFRSAFENFDPTRIAAWGPDHVEARMADAGIVRNRAKIEASILSARAYLTIEANQGFSNYLWSFVDGGPIQNRWRAQKAVPAETPLSRMISKDLKARGFRFCGPTIIYAFMQAVGMVNDHLTACWRHEPCAALARLEKDS